MGVCEETFVYSGIVVICSGTRAYRPGLSMSRPLESCSLNDQTLYFIFPLNRQRTILWKYFYPPDFQPMVPTKTPQIGDKRLAKLFKFSLNFLHESDIELPFTEGDKVHFMHLSCGKVGLKYHLLTF